MKHFYLKTLVLLLMCMVGGRAMAYPVRVNDLYYNLNKSDSTASVTQGNGDYSGAITIPSSIDYGNITYKVTSIGDYAFSNDKNLTSVYIPNSITSLGEGSFSSCTGLKTMNIPNSVTSIGERAFQYCI